MARSRWSRRRAACRPTRCCCMWRRAASNWSMRTAPRCAWRPGRRPGCAPLACRRSCVAIRKRWRLRCGSRCACRKIEYFSEDILKPDSDVKHSLFAARALLPDGWRDNVTLGWNAAGDLTEVRVDAACAPDMLAASGPVIPGMPNLHSHAFQRAMAGLAGTIGDPADSFWSWRALMYRFAE